VIFNSAFHRDELLGALPGLLGRYHDYRELETVAAIAAKSHVLPPGVDLAALDPPAGHAPPPDDGPPIVLWNGRWEYDKQPAAFFAALERLEGRGVPFRLIVAGEHIDPNAPEFAAARERWAGRAVHWGYAPTREAYGALLRRATVVASTAIQEFFGIGVVEALHCGCAPVLPRRLNYPDLIPPALHAACLYDDEPGMVALLASALAAPVPREQWRALAAPYSWERLAPRYDALLAGLADK
jgi:glycosyltransferase involved in cell wall biosynthesis